MREFRGSQFGKLNLGPKNILGPPDLNFCQDNPKNRSISIHAFFILLRVKLRKHTYTDEMGKYTEIWTKLLAEEAYNKFLDKSCL